MLRFCCHLDSQIKMGLGTIWKLCKKDTACQQKLRTGWQINQRLVFNKKKWALEIVSPVAPKETLTYQLSWKCLFYKDSY